MKSQIKISLLTLAFIFSGIMYSVTTSAATGIHLSTSKNNQLMAAFNQYSWTAAPNAVNYKVDLENTATSEKIQIETTNNFIPLHGIPLGTYSITVTAEYADGSSGIIVEDVVVF